MKFDVDDDEVSSMIESLKPLSLVESNLMPFVVNFFVVDCVVVVVTFSVVVVNEDASLVAIEAYASRLASVDDIDRSVGFVCAPNSGDENDPVSFLIVFGESVDISV
jgi:hypothetical protein